MARDEDNFSTMPPMQSLDLSQSFQEVPYLSYGCIDEEQLNAQTRELHLYNSSQDELSVSLSRASKHFFIINVNENDKFNVTKVSSQGRIPLLFCFNEVDVRIILQKKIETSKVLQISETIYLTVQNLNRKRNIKHAIKLSATVTTKQKRQEKKRKPLASMNTQKSTIPLARQRKTRSTLKINGIRKEKENVPSNRFHESPPLLKMSGLNVSSPLKRPHYKLFDDKWSQKQGLAFKVSINYILNRREVSLAVKPLDKWTRKGIIPFLESKERVWQVTVKQNILAAMMKFNASSYFSVFRLSVEKLISEKKICLREREATIENVYLQESLVKNILSFDHTWLVFILSSYWEVDLTSIAIDVKRLRQKIKERFVIKHLEEPLDSSFLSHYIIFLLFADQCVSHLRKENEACKFLPRCLFKRESKFKSTEQLLNDFSREFLRHDRNIIKELANLSGMVKPLSFNQTYYDEYDFDVVDVKKDLKNGLVLSHLVAKTLRQPSPRLRLPPKSRLQKVHNVKVSISMLNSFNLVEDKVESPVRFLAESAPLNIRDIWFKFIKKSQHEYRKESNCLKEALFASTIDPRDIVDGHYTKTLKFLRQLFDSVIIPELISHEKLLSSVVELYALRGVPVVEQGMSFQVLLLEYIQLIVASKNIMVYNFSTCFMNGEVIISIIEHYQPELLKFCSRLDSQIGIIEKIRMCLKLLGINSNFLVLDKASMQLPDSYQTKLFLVVLISKLENLKLLDVHARKIQFFLRNSGSLDGSRHARFGLFKSRVCTLQSTFRGYLVRKRIRQRNAIVRVQAFARSYPHRRNYLSTKSSIIVIQAFLRGSQVLQTYYHIKYCALYIQRFLRRCIQGSIQTKASHVISSFFRGIRDRKLFMFMRNNVIWLQSYLRGNWYRKKFVSLRNNCIKIQSFIRMISQKNYYQNLQDIVRRVQNFIRKSLVMKEYSRLCSATVMVQKIYRSKLCRTKFCTMKSATVRIQSLFRGIMQKRRYSKLKALSITLQSILRMRLMRREFIQTITRITFLQNKIRMALTQKNYSSIKISILRIQTYCRMFIQRNRYIEQRKDVKKLQAFSRQIVCRNRFIRQKSAVVLLQTIIRRYALQKKYLMYKKNVALLQAHVRKKICRNYFFAQRRSATLIQCCFRMYVKNVWFHAIKTRIIRIQSYFRMLKNRSSFKDLRQAVIYLQSVFRGVLIRREYLIIYRKMIQLQACIRRYTVSKRYNFGRSRAIKVQAFWRMHLSKQKVVMEKLMIVKLQAIIRGFIQNNRFNKLYTKAIELQAFFRGHIQREYFLLLKISTIKVQSLARMVLAKKDYKSNRNDVIKIQSLVRTKLARSAYLLQTRKIVNCQSIVRMLVQQRSYKRSICNIKNIQAAIRGWKCFKAFKEKRSCILKMQAFWRGAFCRRTYFKCLLNIVKIQSIIRSYVTQRRFLQKRRSSILIQSIIRMCAEKKKYLKCTSSIVTIQTYIRRFMARLQFMRWQRSVVIIQAVARRYLCRFTFSRKKNAVVLLQSYWKMYTMRITYKTIVSHTINLQSRTRGYLAKRKFYRLLLACTRIQAFYRGIIVKNVYKKTKVAACKVQSVFRMYCDRHKYIGLCSSTVIIQSFLRGSLVREIYEAIRYKVIVVQSVVRTYLAKRKRRVQMDGALMIMNCWKSYLCRRQYQVFKKSATTIQKFYRNLKERIKFMASIRGIIFLQSIYRGNKVRNSSRAAMIQKKLRILRMKRKYDTSNEALRKVPMNERMVRALNWIKTTEKFSLILMAMSELEICTRYSEENARRLLYGENSKNILIVFDVFFTVNRSDPHLRGLLRALTVLKNVLCYYEGMFYVLRGRIDMPTFLAKLIEKLQCTNSNDLFSLAIFLLRKQVEYDERRTLARSAELVKRLEYLLKRKKRGISSSKYTKLNRLLRRLKDK